MKKKLCCANEARFLRLLLWQQGGDEVRWRPGQEAGLAPLPMFEPEIFPTLLGLYVAPPKWFGARGIVPPWPPSLCPCVAGTFSLWCRKGKAFCERALALYGQQHGKDKQNIEFAPLEKFLRTPVLLTWIFLNFWHFSDMFWLFLTCKYNKQKYVNYLINHFFAIFKVSRPETFETETRPERPRPSLETPSLIIRA